MKDKLITECIRSIESASLAFLKEKASETMEPLEIICLAVQSLLSADMKKRAAKKDVQKENLLKGFMVNRGGNA